MQAKPDHASTIDQEGTLLAVITTEALVGVVLDRISEAEAAILLHLARSARLDLMGRDEVPAIRMSEEVPHNRRGQRADARPREVIQAMQALRGCGGEADGT